MEWRNIVINGKELPYKISDTGHIYSLIKKRLLKGSYNSKVYPYKMYFLNGKWYYLHRLVYQSFIGEIPQGYEINHKDMNKANNRISNLEVISHQSNILHARQRKQWTTGRSGFNHSQRTRDKMSRAKYKPVNIIGRNDRIVKTCESIEETAMYLNTYRKKVYRALKTGQLTKFQAGSAILRYANQ